MDAPRRGFLIDTSVLVALEQCRDVAEIPETDEWFVSSITIGEFKHGVLTSRDPASASMRLETWIDTARSFRSLPIDDTVANTWGEYVAIAAAEGRRLPVPDGLIAATAATYGLTLVTQDRDFERYPDLDVLVV